MIVPGCEHGTLEVDQHRVEYRRWRPPPRPDRSPPTLVLLHEGLGCVEMWRDFPAALATRTGCPVLAYSRKGYGGSDPVALPRPSEWMEEEARAELPRLLDVAEIEDYVLVGHSDGGSIAVIHAGSQDARTPGLRGVALLAAHVFNEPACIAGIQEASRAYERGELRSALHRYHRERVDDVFRGWRDAWLDPQFADWSIEALLPAIACPVLVVQGDRDPYGTVSQADAIAAGVRGPVVRLDLEGCGHHPHRERRRETLDAITAFASSA